MLGPIRTAICAIDVVNISPEIFAVKIRERHGIPALVVRYRCEITRWSRKLSLSAGNRVASKRQQQLTTDEIVNHSFKLFLRCAASIVINVCHPAIILSTDAQQFTTVGIYHP